MKIQTIKAMKFLFAFWLLGFATLTAKAQTTTVSWYDKVSIGDNTTLLNANVTIKPTGELYIEAYSPQELQQNRLDITGNYSGESGSKIYLSVTDNTIMPGYGFMDISGTANGSTEIIPNLFEGWQGERMDVIRAKADGSDVNAFYISKTIADCGEYNVFLTHRTENDHLVWSVFVTQTLPCIVQLDNRTLLVNNNSETNGGHKFVYYYWYRNGKLLKEGSHDELGGSYYTDGENLDSDAEYRVETIDTENKHYYSCAYRYTPQNVGLKVKTYPNPVSRGMQVYVEVNTDDAIVLDNATIEIYNAYGQHFGKVEVAGRRITPVDLPPITGVYILKFKSNELETNFKIIVN